MCCEICCKRSAQARSVLSRITGHRLKTDWIKLSGAVAYQVPALQSTLLSVAAVVPDKLASAGQPLADCTYQTMSERGWE